MKCIALFVLVAIAAVAMAQELRGFNPEVENVEPGRTQESGEAKRDKRGFIAFSAPQYYYRGGYNGYSGGYNTYATHYNTPYTYYRSYPYYGYGTYY